MKHTATAVLASALFASCGSTDSARAPEALFELYDQVAADGAMELELDRNGRFIEIEAEVEVATIPDFVAQAAHERYPGVQFTGAEREVQNGVWTWEVKFLDEGRAIELVIDGDGQVLETERELLRDEAPEAVLLAAIEAIPGSNFESVERITAGDIVTYHVKSQIGAARYKVVLSEDGAVLRRVRETPAEIEIPLPDTWSGA